MKTKFYYNQRLSMQWFGSRGGKRVLVKWFETIDDAAKFIHLEKKRKI